MNGLKIFDELIRFTIELQLFFSFFSPVIHENVLNLEKKIGLTMVPYRFIIISRF